MKKILAIVIIALISQAAPALAGGSIGLAIAAGSSPYKSYDDRRAIVPLINYEHQYFYFRGLKAGVKVYEQNSMEVSAFVAYDPTRFKSSDSSDRRLKRLDDRGESWLAGGAIAIHNPAGIFSASLGMDISSHSRGLKGQAAYAYPFDFEFCTLTPTAGLHFADEKYNDYYYGVSKSEARQSGLKAYQADAAFSPFAGLHVDLPINEQVSLFAAGEVVFLAPAIKDSPMVGRSTSHFLTTGVKFSF